VFISKASLGLPPAARRTRFSPYANGLGLAARLTLATALGLLAGAMTEWSVLHLPASLEPLPNTAAPWVLVAFAVALTGRSIGESLVLAVVTLVALTLGFYAGEALRGWSVSRHQVEFWSATSVAVGPLVGLAAGWFRHAGRAAGALGAGVIGGLLAGEAVYGLTSYRYSSPADYWRAQFVLGVGLAIGLTLWRFRGRRLGIVAALTTSLTACAIVGLATLAAYQVL
jgi:hypothetical protein